MHSESRVPNFIIGGAPRSGTTFLCHALDAHPDVYLAKPYIPEPKIFIGPKADRATYAQRYVDYFRAAPSHAVLGEKSTYYLESEDACYRIRDFFDRIKILFLLREPVARAYSNYLWSKKNGLETLPFEEVVELNENDRKSPLPPEKSYARPFHYFERGHYDVFAERYIKAFGQDSIGFFLYENIEANPEKFLFEIQEFIGIKPLPAQTLNPGRINSARELGGAIDERIESRLRDRMRPHVERFARITGLDLSLWKY